MADIWAALPSGATKPRNIRTLLLAVWYSEWKEARMVEDREKIGNGTNDRPIDETIAGTGPGIADDSLAPGEDEIPKGPTDEEVERMAKKLGSPTAEKNTLPLEGE